MSLSQNQKQQITDLNDMVVNAIVPNIMKNVLQYIAYIEDISTPYGKNVANSFDRPRNMSSSGTKTYRLDRFI